MPDSMHIRFWGVRGSIACPGPETARYGGNTPCIEVRCGKRVLIFDAGTGLRPLGNALIRDAHALNDNRMLEADIFLTHCHLDHVMGLPFFAPFFMPGHRLRLWAGNLLPAYRLETVVRQLMASPLFPVEIEVFRASIEYRDFHAGETLQLGHGITLRTAPLDHPDGGTGYRLEYGGRIFVLLCDTESFPGKHDRELIALAKGADVVVYDTTYTEEEIVSRRGWGHSTWPRGVRLAEEAGAKKLFLFHHDPAHDDAFMDAIVAAADHARPGTVAAHEGMIVDL